MKKSNKKIKKQKAQKLNVGELLKGIVHSMNEFNQTLDEFNQTLDEIYKFQHEVQYRANEEINNYRPKVQIDYDRICARVYELEQKQERTKLIIQNIAHAITQLS